MRTIGAASGGLKLQRFAIATFSSWSSVRTQIVNTLHLLDSTLIWRESQWTYMWSRPYWTRLHHWL